MISALLAAMPAPQAPAGAFPTWMPLVFQFGLFILIFWFIILRPQQRQRRDHEDALKAVKRGDRIVTAGGIIGEVIHVKETVVNGAPQQTMEDEVTIKSGDTRIIVERGRIAKLVTATTATTAA